MIKALHPAAGAVAFATIATFWTSTIGAELFGTTETVVAVKAAIPWGFVVLLPAMAAAGLSGARLAKGRGGGRIDAKRARMKRIAATSVLILIPAVQFLAGKAARGEFDAMFYGV